MEHMWVLAGIVLGVILWIKEQQPKK